MNKPIKVSPQFLLVATTLQSRPNEWLTSADIAKRSENLAERTVRAHTKKLVEMGLLEVGATFPSYHYRWSEKGATQHAEYVRQIETAKEIFGKYL